MTQFPEATPEEISAKCAAAAEAFSIEVDRPKIVALLRDIATALEDLGDELINVADSETNLGPVRLNNERARTTGQFRAFADLVESGAHLERHVDAANDAHADLRSMLVPVGPVAVFGAANFPFAYSVPGGDTAAALAAGCPVITKGHPGHAETCDLCARTISSVVEAHGFHSGYFSLVQGATPAVGEALVLDPRIKAVGFTGSFRGGRALHDLAATRPEPIQVHAEMGSLNPIFITDEALQSRSEEITTSIGEAIFQGQGQFCTKPGLVFTRDADALTKTLTDYLADKQPAPMLNDTIDKNFRARLSETQHVSGIDVALDAAAHILTTDIDSFLADEKIREEMFGPASIVVECPPERMTEAMEAIGGSLTATIVAETGSDDGFVDELVPVLMEHAGRIIFNGVPTGVAVVPSMNHGGPYPATLSNFSSVGVTSIRRFLRPVTFQNAPKAWLPTDLKDA